ncbi:MAG: DMT family transporter [Defluviicoccus sp.]
MRCNSGPFPSSAPPVNPLEPLQTSFRRLPATTQGALLMVGACAGFSVMMLAVRQLSAELHPFVVAFWRNLIGLGFMLPWALSVGLGRLRTGRFGMHALRSLMGLSAMLCLFMALSLMPLAEVTALTFTAPLFATVGAALILGERVRLRRWSATVIGFLGALLILKPDAGLVQPAALIALTAAVFIAGAMLTIKSLSDSESPNAIVVIMGLLMTPASLVPAAFVWSWPVGGLMGDAWGWIVLMGFSATIGQVCLTRAFKAADASAVIPFDFSRLVFVGALGYWMFGEIPDVWTWLGGGVILAASVYIARREAQLARLARAHAARPNVAGGAAS